MIEFYKNFKDIVVFKRFRRRRINPILRELIEETNVNINDFIYPLFVRSGEGIKSEVPSMPDVFQMSIDEIIEECNRLNLSGYTQ